jgi:hypothetical protein
MKCHIMAPDSAAAAGADPECEVMAAVDGPDERFIIAELCRDDAWLATPLAGAVDLESNR